MAQVVSHQPLDAEFWVQSQASPYKICGERSGTGTGFLPSTSVPCQNYCTNAPHSFIPLSQKKADIIIKCHTIKKKLETVLAAFQNQAK
jgi:hypothetical protein